MLTAPTLPQAGRGTRPKALADPGVQAAAGLVLAAVGYWLFVTLVIYPGLPWASPSVLPDPRSWDPVQMSWFLSWTPFAILHGHNPLFTNYIDVPSGANLAANTSVPLLGILAAPITYTLGAAASFDVLAHLALAGSALAMFFVLGAWTRWWPGRFLGGWLYGFSSYMAFQSHAHLDLIFLPIPPLVLWCLYELVVRQRHRPLAVGAAAGALVAAQFLIDEEVCADLVILSALGLALAAVTHRKQARDHVAKAAGGLAALGVVAAAGLAFPVAMSLVGPQHLTASIQPAAVNAGYHQDLLDPVVRGLRESSVVSTTPLKVLHWRNPSGYLGAPLVALLVALTLCWRRVAMVWFAAAMAIAAFVLSLGPRLTVGGHATAVPLPGWVLEHIPLVDNLLPTRISAFVALFAAVVLAVGLDRTLGWLRQGRLEALRVPRRGRAMARHEPDDPSGTAGRAPRGRSRASWWASVGLSALGVACLLPVALAYRPEGNVRHINPDTAAVAQWLAAHTPSGGVVLALPPPTGAADLPMLWQVQSHMAFRLVDGYAFVPDGTRHSRNKAVLASDYMAILGTGGRRFAAEVADNPASAKQAALRACRDVARVARTYHVDSMAVWRAKKFAIAPVIKVLEASMGPPGFSGHGAALWADVPRRVNSAGCVHHLVG